MIEHIFPKDWDTCKLIDACEDITDGSHFSPKEDKNGEYRIATVANIKNNQIDLESCKKISKFDFEKLIKNGCKAEFGDVLFTKDGTVGLSFVFKQNIDVALLSSIAIIKTKKELLNPEFCSFALKSPIVFQKIVGSKRGTGLKRIILKDIKMIKIPLPSINEQRSIATILTTIDDSIQKSDELLNTTERLKKGLMQTLLVKGIRHNEFKISEIGKIPNNWDVVQLKEVVENENDIVAGPFGSNLKVCDYRAEGIPIIRLQNIERNQFVNKDIKFISPEKATELNYHSFRSGDVILAKLGDPIGKTCIVPDFLKEGIVVADVVRIRVSPKKVVKEYIEYTLNSSICATQLKRETIGSTRPRVNIPQIRNLIIPYPPLQEQQKIVDVLSSIDKKLNFDRKRKEKLETIKKGLMNDLLTGKKRVRGFNNA